MNPWPVNEVLPHSGQMILLDEVLACDDDQVVCVRTIRRGDAFVADDGSFPAWAGVELMAQAIAAWAGCHERDAGHPVRLGFLLGARGYTCNADSFPEGTTLRIEATRQMHDADGMGVFACRIEAPNLLAEARLTVISPPDASSLASSHPSDLRHA